MKDDIERPAHPCFVLGFKLLLFHHFYYESGNSIVNRPGRIIFIVLTAGGFVCLIINYGRIERIFGPGTQKHGS